MSTTEKQRLDFKGKEKHSQSLHEHVCNTAGWTVTNLEETLIQVEMGYFYTQEESD